MDNNEMNEPVRTDIEEVTAQLQNGGEAPAPCPLSPEELAREIAKVLDSKKARDIKLLQVGSQTVLADYFVICNGTSNTQIKALSGEVEDKLAESSILPAHIEGYNEASWILMDYSSVVVHIFNRDTRKFYNLEKLWGQATEIPLVFDDEEQENKEGEH